MAMFPQGSNFLKINTNDKNEAAVLDLLLDGTKETPIGLNGVQVPSNTLQVTYMAVSSSIVYIVISPKGAASDVIPSSMMTQE